MLKEAESLVWLSAPVESLFEPKLTVLASAKFWLALLSTPESTVDVWTSAKACGVATAPPPIKALAAKTPFNKLVVLLSRFASTLTSSGLTPLLSLIIPKRVNRHCTHCLPDLYILTRVVREASSNPFGVTFFFTFLTPSH